MTILKDSADLQKAASVAFRQPLAETLWLCLQLKVTIWSTFHVFRSRGSLKGKASKGIAWGPNLEVPPPHQQLLYPIKLFNPLTAQPI